MQLALKNDKFKPFRVKQNIKNLNSHLLVEKCTFCNFWIGIIKWMTRMTYEMHKVVILIKCTGIRNLLKNVDNV